MTLLVPQATEVVDAVFPVDSTYRGCLLYMFSKFLVGA